MDYQDIIQFCFYETKPEQWFRQDDAFDLLITVRFSQIREQAIRGELESWRFSVQGRLAEIIAIDQFSRNIHRNSAEAYRYDPLALILAQELRRHPEWRSLSIIEMRFALLPWMHSESRVIHEKALSLYQQLGVEQALKFEIEHKSIIDRFGRYPQRNRALNRSDTPEESVFLSNQSD